MPRKSIFAAAVVALFAFVGLVQAQQTITLQQQTIFDYASNTPPDSAAAAFSCDGRGYSCGGSGSYDNPLTVATASGAFSECAVFWYPRFNKYLINQGLCTGCSDNHIDIWLGIYSSGGSGASQCADQLTVSGSESLILDPSASYDADTSPLYSVSGGCMS